METVCMFYNLKRGGKEKDRYIEELYRYASSILGCEANIVDYCMSHECPNNGKIDDEKGKPGLHLPCGSLPEKCYLKMDEVDLSEDEEENEE